MIDLNDSKPLETLVGCKITKAVLLKEGAFGLGNLPGYDLVKLFVEKEGVPPLMLIVPARTASLWCPPVEHDPEWVKATYAA